MKTSHLILGAVLVGCPAAVAAIELQLPVACTPGRDCFIQNYVDRDPSPSARDHRCGTLSYDAHTGTDFRLPTLPAAAGTSVLAAADGVVARWRDGISDVSVRKLGPASVKGKECGNAVVVSHEDGFETQYCHLAQGSVTVRPGDAVKAGQTLGRVGLSGLTEYPHLHLSVRRHGNVVDPFAFGAAPGACGGGTSLWASPLQPLLAYKPSVVLNVGFALEPPTMETIESGETARKAPDRDAPVLIAFARAIGLKAGDTQQITILGPDRQTIAENTARPAADNQAQAMIFAGARKPRAGWPRGEYQARYRVMRGETTALDETFSVTLAAP